MSDGTLLNRETFEDVLVNLVPLCVLAGFIVMFVVFGPYRADPLYLGVQLSLVAIPALVLLVVTYYGLRAIEGAKSGDGELPPPGYSETDAEATRAADD